jgi:putative membrane protein
MDLLVGTFVLRPYVFGFLAAFLLAGAVDLGWRRTLLFGAWVGPLAWLSEFSSTRTGIPFGLYHYTGTTRAQELFIADVPFMDCLSFTFLAYAAFCLARAVLSRHRVSPATLALASGALMMLLDVVIDPIAVRGDRWFLGRIFYYPEGGVYFGVPLSNFAGWMTLGTAGVGGYLLWSLWTDRGSGPAVAGAGYSSEAGGRAPLTGTVGTEWSPASAGSGPAGTLTGWGATAFDRYGRRAWPGIALYYAVLGFNLVVTGWIGEWRLLMVGAALHAVTAAVLLNLGLRPAARWGLEKQRA